MGLSAELKKLAELRAKAEAFEIQKRTAEAQAKATPQWEEYDKSISVYAQAVSDAVALESLIKASAIEKYNGFTVGKKPADGLEIKLFTVARITNEKAAREWALVNFTPALKLDTKAIEKAGKDGLTPDGLVTIETEYRAQIASDLSAYL